MSEKVSNEKAEQVLLAFHWAGYDDEIYEEFLDFHGGTLKMVFHKYVGWTLGISDSGYENVQMAYRALEELDYLDEATDEHLAYIVSLFERTYGKPL